MEKQVNEMVTDVINTFENDLNNNLVLNIFNKRYLSKIVSRLRIAHKIEADIIHQAMVILCGIEMEDSSNPPRLWTALEDAYDKLSDALGTNGDTTADVEEAKASGRHFVVSAIGDAAKMREALKKINEIINSYSHALISTRKTIYTIEEIIKQTLSSPTRNCDMFSNETDAQQKFLNDVWLVDADRKSVLEQHKIENWTKEMLLCYARWLLSPVNKGNNDESK